MEAIWKAEFFFNYNLYYLKKFLIDRTGHGGPQHPERLILPSRPREWHLRPWLREEGATASGGVETWSGGAKRFQALGPGLTNEVPGAAVAPPLPPRDSWIGCWCGLSPATPHLNLRFQGPAPFADLSGSPLIFFRPPVITNRLMIVRIMETADWVLMLFQTLCFAL